MTSYFSAGGPQDPGFPYFPGILACPMCLLIQIVKVDTGWVLFFAFLLSMDTGSKRTCQILSIVFPSVKSKTFQLHNWGEGSDGFESVVFITGPSMLLFLRKLIYLNSGQLMEFIAQYYVLQD